MTRRRPIRQFSKKMLAEMEARRAFSKAVIRRAHGRCERCHDCQHWSMLHAHHRLPISQGGKHDPKNGAALCFRCHRLVHDHGEDAHGGWEEWLVTRNKLRIRKEAG